MSVDVLETVVAKARQPGPKHGEPGWAILGSPFELAGQWGRVVP